MSHERKDNFGSYLKYNGVTTTRIPSELHSHDNDNNDMYVLFQNNRMVMVSKYGAPIIYDLAKKEVIHQFSGDSSHLAKLDDDHCLVFNGREHTLKKINIHTIKEENLGQLRPTNISYNFLILPNGLFAYYNEKCFGLYDLNKKIDIDYHELNTRRVYLSADKQALYIFDADEKGNTVNLKIYDINTRQFKPCHILQNIKYLNIYSNKMLPLSNNRFLSALKPEYTDELEVWDLKQETSLLKLPPAINKWLTTTLVELPDNILAITGEAWDNTQNYIWFYDLKTGKKFDADIKLDNIIRITNFIYQPDDTQLTCLCVDKENKHYCIANFDIGLGNYLAQKHGESLDMLSHPKKVVMEYLGWMKPKEEDKQDEAPQPSAENKIPDTKKGA